MSMNELNKHHTLLGFLVASFLGIIFLIYSVFMDGKIFNAPVQFNGDMKTEFAVYHPGEVVRAKVSYCKYRNIPAHLQWNLVDTYIKTYLAKDVSTETGCKDGYFEIEKIPLDQMSGIVHFETLVEYDINKFNTVRVPLRTNAFIVMRQDEPEELNYNDGK